MGMKGKVNKDPVKLMRAVVKKKTGTHIYQTNVNQKSLDTRFNKTKKYIYTHKNPISHHRNIVNPIIMPMFRSFSLIPDSSRAASLDKYQERKALKI